MIHPHDPPFGDHAGWSALANLGPRRDRGDRPMPPVPALIAGVVTVVSVMLFAAWTLDRRFADPVRHGDPDSVATAFLQRHAAGDSAACGLATDMYRTELRRAGSCPLLRDGPGAGEYHVSVLSATTCGDRHSTAAQVTPPGRLGTSYAVVSLERVGDRWQVAALLPVADRAVLRPYQCEATR